MNAQKKNRLRQNNEKLHKKLASAVADFLWIFFNEYFFMSNFSRNGLNILRYRVYVHPTLLMFAKQIIVSGEIYLIHCGFIVSMFLREKDSTLYSRSYTWLLYCRGGSLMSTYPPCIPTIPMTLSLSQIEAATDNFDEIATRDSLLFLKLDIWSIHLQW